MKKKIVPYILVSLQLGSLLYLLLSGPKIATRWDGLLLEAAGVILGLYAIYVAGIHNVNVTPTPKNGGRLIMSGPYALVRHPMYLAQVLAVIPLVIDKPDSIRLAVLTLLVVTLIVKMFYEEKGLVKQFGENYLAYSKKTYRILPWIL